MNNLLHSYTLIHRSALLMSPCCRILYIQADFLSWLSTLDINNPTLLNVSDVTPQSTLHVGNNQTIRVTIIIDLHLWGGPGQNISYCCLFRYLFKFKPSLLQALGSLKNRLNTIKTQLCRV